MQKVLFPSSILESYEDGDALPNGRPSAAVAPLYRLDRVRDGGRGKNYLARGGGKKLS